MINMNITTILAIYAISVVIIFAITAFYAACAALDGIDVTLKKAVTVSLFWPLYLLFNLPRWIWIALKFIYSCFRQLINDFKLKNK